MTSSRRRRDRGQAAVEFAIALPLVVLAILVVLQVAVVVSDQFAVELAAREAARAAAVSGDPSVSARGAVSDPRIGLTTVVGANTVTVTATRSVSIAVPIIGSFVDGTTVEATTTMQLEPP